MEQVREMLEEAKEILIKGYKQRGKDSLAILIEQFDVDDMVNVVVPLLLAGLRKVENEDEGASL